MIALEEIDLDRLSEDLNEQFRHNPPVGYLRGKTALRDAVVERLGCSVLEAEELVDTMESRGFLHFDGSPARRSEADSAWEIETDRDE